MADLPTVNALEELREENKEGLQSLGSTFKGSIESLTNVSSSMAQSLRAMLEFDKKAAQDAKIAQFQLIENLRESARLQKENAKKDDKKVEGASLFKDTGLIGLAGILVAFGGAIAGLRGWELKAIRSLKDVGGISTTITNGLKILKLNVLKVFGLTPAGIPIRDPATGKFMKSMPVTQQIGLRFQALKASVLKVFGLGVDGKPIAQTKLPKPIQGISARIASLASTISQFVGNTFSAIAKPFGKGGKALGDIVKAIGRTLKAIPIVGQIIGFLFAAFDGITTAFSTEGPLWKKITAGIAAFTGNFIGAPLDLLKDIISWISGKLGFEGVEAFLDSFSIEDLITDALTAIPDMIGKAVDWIGTLFTDPTEALKQLWQGYVGAWEGIGQFVMDFAVKPAWEFVKGLFGFGEDEAKIPEDFNPVTYIINKVTGFLNKIQESIGKLFSGEIDIDSLLPDFQIPEFPNPFKGIGEKISSLDFDTFNLGSWFGGALDLNLGDKLKSTLAELFGAEGVATTVSGTTPTAGAETDVRSRNVAQATAQPNVTVTAPQTSIQTDNSTKVNRTSVAPASSRRSVSYRDRYGAQLGVAGIRN